MRPAHDSRRPAGTDLIDVILDDHRQIEHLLRELRNEDTDRARVLSELSALLGAHFAATERILHKRVDISLDQDILDLEAAVEAHIRDEERTLLNELRRSLSPSDRTALGRAFTAESRNYAAIVRTRPTIPHDE